MKEESISESYNKKQTSISFKYKNETVLIERNNHRQVFIALLKWLYNENLNVWKGGSQVETFLNEDEKDKEIKRTGDKSGFEKISDNKYLHIKLGASRIKMLIIKYLTEIGVDIKDITYDNILYNNKNENITKYIKNVKIKNKDINKNTTVTEFDNLKNILLQHCNDMNILKHNSTIKKKESVLITLLGIMAMSNMTIIELKKFIDDVKNNNVFDITFFSKGGNIDNYINPDYIIFMKFLWDQKVGLGTPNSAIGSGELMFSFSSSFITKANHGDLCINNKIIELKGEQARIDAKISGNNFRLKTLDVCRKYNLTPNKTSAKNKIECVEIEKRHHLEYWKKELNKLTINKQKEFITDWLQCISENFNKENIEKIFINNTFDQEIFIKEIAKSLFSEYIKNNNIDSFILLGDGTNAKIINNQKDFEYKIDNDIILVKRDFFRINADYNIGWYIE
jgi:hypothetical protein